MSVCCRRVGGATAISVVHSEGVMNFIVTDAELEAELTPRQLAARRMDIDPR
jgi:hypothetical protein